jgi:hypothetical protein
VSGAQLPLAKCLAEELPLLPNVLASKLALDLGLLPRKLAVHPCFLAGELPVGLERLLVGAEALPHGDRLNRTDALGLARQPRLTTLGSLGRTGRPALCLGPLAFGPGLWARGAPFGLRPFTFRPRLGARGSALNPLGPGGSALLLPCLALGDPLEAEIGTLGTLGTRGADPLWAVMLAFGARGLMLLLSLRTEFLPLLLALGASLLTFGAGFLAATAMLRALGQSGGRRSGGHERDDQSLFHGPNPSLARTQPRPGAMSSP